MSWQSISSTATKLTSSLYVRYAPGVWRRRNFEASSGDQLARTFVEHPAAATTAAAAVLKTSSPEKEKSKEEEKASLARHRLCLENWLRFQMTALVKRAIDNNTLWMYGVVSIVILFICFNLLVTHAFVWTFGNKSRLAESMVVVICDLLFLGCVACFASECIIKKQRQQIEWRDENDTELLHALPQSTVTPNGNGLLYIQYDDASVV